MVLLCKKLCFALNTKNTAENEEAVCLPPIPRVLDTRRSDCYFWWSPVEISIHIFYCIFGIPCKASLFALQSYDFLGFLLLSVPTVQFLFNSSFFLICLVHFHQEWFCYLYNSFHVCCFHYIVRITAFYDWYIIFIFICNIVMKISLTLWHQVIVKSSP